MATSGCHRDELACELAVRKHHQADLPADPPVGDLHEGAFWYLERAQRRKARVYLRFGRVRQRARRRERGIDDPTLRSRRRRSPRREIVTDRVLTSRRANVEETTFHRAQKGLHTSVRFEYRRGASVDTGLVAVVFPTHTRAHAGLL
jgi:hypothetical protein